MLTIATYIHIKGKPVKLKIDCKEKCPRIYRPPKLEEARFIGDLSVPFAAVSVYHDMG